MNYHPSPDTYHNAKPLRSTSTVGMPVTPKHILVQKHSYMLCLTGRTNDSRNAPAWMFCLYDRYPGTMLIQTERAGFTSEEKSSVRMDLLF